MKTVKRLISVLLILALVASACGCGKDSKTKKNKAKKVSVSVKSLEDAVEAVPKYDEGSYKLSLKINVNDYIKADLEAAGKKKGAAATLDSYRDSFDIDIASLLSVAGNFGLSEKSLDVDKISLKSSLSDILTISDKKAYINLDSLIGDTLKMKTGFGYYSLPLPLPDDDDFTSYSEKCFKLLSKAVAALTKDSAAEAKDGSFTVNFESMDELKSGVKALLTFVKDNSEDIADLAVSGKNLTNFSEYPKTLRNALIKDLEELGDYLKENYNIDTEKAVGRLKFLDSDNVTEIIEDTDAAGFAEIIKNGVTDILDKFDSIQDNYWDMIYEKYKQINPEITVKAASDEYKVGVKINTVYEKFDIGFDFEYSFTPEEVEISAPKKVSTMTDIAKEAESHKDDLMDKYKKLLPLLSGSGDGLSLSKLIDFCEEELNVGAIPVIAVGIIGPAYLRYVEKSRVSADLSDIDYILRSAETLVTDVEYEDYFNYSGDTFTIENNNGTLTFTVSSSLNDQAAQSDWEELLNAGQGIRLKSSTGKNSSDKIVGKLQQNGAISWSIEQKGSFLSNSMATSFLHKYFDEV